MTRHSSQSGQVKLQNRKSSLASSVFWIMKINSSPMPESDAIAPPVSRRVVVPSPGLRSTMKAPPIRDCRAKHRLPHVGPRCSGRRHTELWTRFAIKVADAHHPAGVVMDAVGVENTRALL